MRTIKSASRSFVPAGHENPLSPGVLKKVLLEKADLQPGRMQMVNWASLGVGKELSPDTTMKTCRKSSSLCRGRRKSRSKRTPPFCVVAM